MLSILNGGNHWYFEQKAFETKFRCNDVINLIK
jgi:hypothetical protein